MKRISKNPITNYFPKKKKIDKIIPPPEVHEHNPTQSAQGDEVDLTKQDNVLSDPEPEMNPDEILNLQPKTQEEPTWNNPTGTQTEAYHENQSNVKTSSDEKSSSKISDPFENAVLPDLNSNLNMNIPSSSIIPNDDAMETDSIKSDDSDDINVLDESIMTAGPGIRKSQNAPRNYNAPKSNKTFDDLLNTSDVDGFSPIDSVSDEENNITTTENAYFDQTLDQSSSSAPLFSVSMTASSHSEKSKRRNHLQDISNRKNESHNQHEVDNPFNRASIRMRNNLNRAIEDPSSAYNILQTILKSQTDPAFLSKTAKFPSKYNTPFSM